MLRKVLFGLKQPCGLREFSAFESFILSIRENDRKYVFEIKSTPIVLWGSHMIVNLMSRRGVKLAVVDLVEKLGCVL